MESGAPRRAILGLPIRAPGVGRELTVVASELTPTRQVRGWLREGPADGHHTCLVVLVEARYQSILELPIRAPGVGSTLTVVANELTPANQVRCWLREEQAEPATCLVVTVEAAYRLVEVPQPVHDADPPGDRGPGRVLHV